MPMVEMISGILTGASNNILRGIPVEFRHSSLSKVPEGFDPLDVVRSPCKFGHGLV